MGAWLRCSSVEDPQGVFSFVAPRHPPICRKTAPLVVFRQALIAFLKTKSRAASAPRHVFNLALLLLVFACLPLAAPAALFWDADGSTTAATGGTGNWDSTSSLWRSGSSTGTLGLWLNDGTAAATFGGTAGTISLTENISINSLTLNVGQTIASPGGSTLTFSGASASINGTSGSAATISAIIAGSVALTKAQSVQLTLSGANTFSGGLAVTGGRLNFNNNSAAGSGTVSVGSQTANVSLGTTAATTTLANDFSFAPTATKTIDLFATSGNSLTLNGVVSGSGDFSVGATGSGTVVLGGNNTFTGALSISAGILRLGNDGALNSATPAALSMSGGTLRLNGHSVTVSGLSGAAGTIDNGVAGTATLTVSRATGSDTFSGVLANGTAGTLSLAKSGAGTLILGGANTFTGGTTVSGGSLQLGANNVLPDSGTFTLSGGTLVLNKKTDYAGPLSVVASSVITLSAGAGGVLSFNGGSWTAGTLVINGWTGVAGGTGTGDQLYFRDSGNNAVIVAANLLGNINFGGYTGGAAQLGSGELVPAAVPEPGTIWAAVFLGAVVLAGRGRVISYRLSVIGGAKRSRKNL